MRRQVREPKLTTEQAAQFMELVDVPSAFPEVVPPTKATRFELSRCQFCGGMHARECPRVRRVSYADNGNVQTVEYFADYDDTNILWPEEVVEALDAGQPR